MNGWIKLHRKLIEWEWYKDSNTLHLFIHLLLTANHEPQKWRGITIERGQVLTGRKELSFATGISEQSLRTSINRLKSTSEITINPTNKYSVITICNYDSYQSEKSQANQQPNQQPNQQLTNNQPTTNHKQEYKEVKECKEVKEPPLTPQGEDVESPNVSKKIKGQKTKVPIKEITYPFTSEKFLQVWGEYMTMKKQIRKPITAHQKALNRLSKYPEEFAIELIETAISCDYQGCVFPSTPKIFEEWKQNRTGKPFNKRMSFTDLQNITPNEQPAF